MLKMNDKPSEEELRSMLSEGQTLYKISRYFNTTIPEIFKLGRGYGIHFAYDHNHIPKPTKQDLESMYHGEHLTQEQIAKEFGVSQMTVSNRLRYYNIQARVPIPPKEVLERMYSEDGMTLYQISRKFNVDHISVGRWVRNCKIQTKVPIPPKEVLERMYSEDGMTQEQIASEFIITRQYVSILLRKYNIPTRGSTGTLAVPMPSINELQKHIAEGLNQHQIAENYNKSDATIFRWCEYYGIPGMVNNFRCTTEEHINWRDAVFARDNYICQECGSQDDLRGHHIKPYCDYPELELDIDNGITLCKHCHEQTFGHEYQYIVKYEDIVLRDRGIGDNNYEHIN